MKKIFTLIAAVLMAVNVQADEDIMARFNYTWNGAESITNNSDGTLTFNSAAWGGLAAYFGVKDEVTGVETFEDWSAYGKLVFEYSEATTVNTQILVQFGEGADASVWGNIGIKSLEIDLSTIAEASLKSIKQAALQTSAATTLTITKIYLVSAGAPLTETTIWEGTQDLGHEWDGSLAVQIGADQFAGLNAGDKIRVTVTPGTYEGEYGVYSQLKFCVNSKDWPVLTGVPGVNEYDCVTVSGNSFAFELTADDLAKLKESGMAICGYNLTINKVELLTAGTTGIDTLPATKTQGNAMYNLAGQKVSRDYKGIVIRNGRKVMQ